MNAVVAVLVLAPSLAGVTLGWLGLPSALPLTGIGLLLAGLSMRFTHPWSLWLLLATVGALCGLVEERGRNTPPDVLTVAGGVAGGLLGALTGGSAAVIWTLVGSTAAAVAGALARPSPARLLRLPWQRAVVSGLRALTAGVVGGWMLFHFT